MFLEQEAFIAELFTKIQGFCMQGWCGMHGVECMVICQLRLDGLVRKAAGHRAGTPPNVMETSGVSV